MGKKISSLGLPQTGKDVFALFELPLQYFGNGAEHMEDVFVLDHVIDTHLLLARGQDPRLPEGGQMLGQAGLLDSQLAHHLPHGRLALLQILDDRQAGRVRQRTQKVRFDFEHHFIDRDLTVIVAHILIGSYNRKGIRRSQ